MCLNVRDGHLFVKSNRITVNLNQLSTASSISSLAYHKHQKWTEVVTHINKQTPLIYNSALKNEIKTWQVRIECRSSRRSWTSLSSLTTFDSNSLTSSETSSNSAWSRHQLTRGWGRPVNKVQCVSVICTWKLDLTVLGAVHQWRHGGKLSKILWQPYYNQASLLKIVTMGGGV